MAANVTNVIAAEECILCHQVAIKGVHASLPCTSCHGKKVKSIGNPASVMNGAIGCIGCHRGYSELFNHSMGSRNKEKLFVERTAGKMDPAFFQKNCNSCHLRSCTDCHGVTGHAITRADDRSCFACHKGYFVGTDYYGMAPREDSLRYQRGEVAYGEKYLKMAPDVHAEAGLSCGSCHTMKSLSEGAKSSKTCNDCHKVKRTVIEHRIGAHLEKMECYACHSAWTPQEYGTFYIRFADSSSQQSYRVRENLDDYVKSAYIRKQDAPPLGINAKGMVSPIRPEFILYFTDVRNDRPGGVENLLLAAEWRAFFPHTVRRGTAMCDGCHNNPRRFIMERQEDRIYRLQTDGMTLHSFWDRTGQRVVNGDFFPILRYRKMSEKGPAYWNAYIEKWKRLVNRVESSSEP